jgi:DNA-binding MarR family transcriptional regulator
MKRDHSSATQAAQLDYVPVVGSLPARTIMYFAANPEEEMYTRDLALKFDANPSGIAAGLAKSIEAGYISRSGGRQSGEGAVYSAGPKLGEIAAAIQAAAQAPALTFGAPRRHRRLAPLNVAELKVETGVEIQSVRRDKGHTVYDAAFDKLEAVGQSFAVPIGYRESMKKAAQAYQKRTGHKLAIVTVSIDQARVHRTA